MAFGLALLATALGPLVPTIESTLSLRLIVNLFLLIAAALWVISNAIEGRLRLLRLGIGPWFALFALALVSGVVNANYKHPAFPHRVPVAYGHGGVLLHPPSGPIPSRPP